MWYNVYVGVFVLACGCVGECVEKQLVLFQLNTHASHLITQHLATVHNGVANVDIHQNKTSARVYKIRTDRPSIRVTYVGVRTTYHRNDYSHLWILV